MCGLLVPLSQLHRAKSATPTADHHASSLHAQFSIYTEPCCDKYIVWFKIWEFSPHRRSSPSCRRWIRLVRQCRQQVSASSPSCITLSPSERIIAQRRTVTCVPSHQIVEQMMSLFILDLFVRIMLLMCTEFLHNTCIQTAYCSSPSLFC